jgi:glycosyltransferase involved in cell wall biosynthesis
MKWMIDEYVAVGEGNRKVAARDFKVPIDRIRLIHNSVDTELFSPRKSPDRDNFAFPPGVLLVGAAGRLSKEKGQDVLIAAAKHVVDALPAARFVIAGTGPRKTQTESEIRRLSLENVVRLLGVRNDMPRFYQSLDLFVLPSRFEGMPVCLLEAMACGCPCVVTDIEGCRELVSDGREGLVVPPEDPEAMAGAILELLRDPEKRSVMGKAAREKVLTVASPASAVDAHLEMYRECLTRKRRRGA